MAKLPPSVVGASLLSQRMLKEHRAANPEGRMPLMEHIRELRSRLLKAMAAIAVGFAIGLIPQVYNPLWRFIYHPFAVALRSDHARLVINSIFGAFILRVQVAFFFGLIVTGPFWLYQLWAFIAPGLYRREKRWTYLFVGTAAPLFVTGAVIAYYAMSRGLGFLLGLT